jgi:hypothetical protein
MPSSLGSPFPLNCLTPWNYQTTRSLCFQEKPLMCPLLLTSSKDSVSRSAILESPPTPLTPRHRRDLSSDRLQLAGAPERGRVGRAGSEVRRWSPSKLTAKQKIMLSERLREKEHWATADVQHPDPVVLRRDPESQLGPADPGVSWHVLWKTLSARLPATCGCRTTAQKKLP